MKMGANAHVIITVKKRNANSLHKLEIFKVKVSKRILVNNKYWRSYHGKVEANNPLMLKVASNYYGVKTIRRF